MHQMVGGQERVPTKRCPQPCAKFPGVDWLPTWSARARLAKQPAATQATDPWKSKEREMYKGTLQYLSTASGPHLLSPSKEMLCTPCRSSLLTRLQHSYTVNPNQAPAFLLTLSLPAAAQVLVSPTKPTNSVALTNTKPTNSMKSLTKTEDSLWDCMSGTKQAQTL